MDEKQMEDKIGEMLFNYDISEGEEKRLKEEIQSLVNEAVKERDIDIIKRIRALSNICKIDFQMDAETIIERCIESDNFGGIIEIKFKNKKD